MTPLRKVGLYAQAALYLAGGTNHFLHKAFYVAIMPTHYTHPDALVQVSGVAEMLGGAGLLLPATRPAAAVGITAMLIVFLDVHIFMVRHPERFPGVPHWLLWARLPFQFVLIAYALAYAGRSDLDQL